MNHTSPVITCMVGRVMVVAAVAVASTGMTIVISPQASPAAASSCQARAPRRRAAINSAVAMSSGTYTVATTGTIPNDHWRSRAGWLRAHISTGDATHTKHDQFDADGNTGSPGALSVAERAKADFAEVAGQLGLTPLQARTVLWLERPSAMGGLAEHLSCDASNVTGLADRLETMAGRARYRSGSAGETLRLTRRGNGCGRHVGQLILRDPAYRLWFDAEHGLVRVILIEVGEQFVCSFDQRVGEIPQASPSPPQLGHSV
jgi:hypothetical protein